jgi:hypothetical protein
MRGRDERTGELFSYVDLEARVRADHPLRAIPSLSAMSRTLMPSRDRRSMCLKCLMVSFLLAGIRFSSMT